MPGRPGPAAADVEAGGPGRGRGAPSGLGLGGRRRAVRRVLAVLLAPLAGAVLWDAGVLAACAAAGRAPARLVPRGAVVPEDLFTVEAELTMDVLQDWLAFTSLEAESAECVALGAAGGALATLRTRDGPLARVNPVFLGGGGEADRASFHVTLSDIDHTGIFDAAALACELKVHVALFGVLGGRASLSLRYEMAHDDSALSPSVSGKDILSHSRVTSVGASGAIVEVDNKVLRAVTKNATDTLRPLLDSVEFLDVHVPSLVPKAAVEGHYNGSHYGLDLGMDMEDFVFDVLCALDEERDCKTDLVLSFDCSAMTGGAGGQPCSALGRDVMAHVGGLIFPGSKKSTGVPSIAGAEAPADLGKSVEEPFDVVPGSAIAEASGCGRDLLVFYEEVQALQLWMPWLTSS